MNFLIGVSVFGRMVDKYSHRNIQVQVPAESRAEAIQSVEKALSAKFLVEPWKARCSASPEDFYGRGVVITVNGERSEVRDAPISYEDVVELSGLAGELIVTWARVGGMGSLSPGREVEPKQGMAFFVAERS